VIDRSEKKKAFIALGSNISPRLKFIKEALSQIETLAGVSLLRQSSVYDTFPEGNFPPGSLRFLNKVVEVDTTLQPATLLEKLDGIEKKFGRNRRKKNKSRQIDLDILLFDDIILKRRNFTIPHPRAHLRDFVLFGLNEIAPEVRHPVLNERICDIFDKRAMKIIREPEEARKIIENLKSGKKKVSLIPTMGNLHNGHLSLIRKARQETDFVCVSIFVNPAQFGPKEDYSRYPRTFGDDIRIARKEGADLIFAPSATRMYKSDHSTYIDVETLSDSLCGAYREGHFRGVATIVAKLLYSIPADMVYLGWKDAQQAFIIRRMVRDLNIPAGTRVLPTVRERDGLAVSSRNSFLNGSERKEAPRIYGSLCMAKKLISGGERNPARVAAYVKRYIKRYTRARIEYFSIVRTTDLKPVRPIKGKVLIALAVFFGKTRLIDNIRMNVR